MEIALLNSLVLTVPGFYKAEKITFEEVQQWLKHYDGRYKSFIGHKSTAQFLQELLGIKIEQNRKIFRHMKYQKAICFSLYERYPENIMLSKKDLEKAKYQFFINEIGLRGSKMKRKTIIISSVIVLFLAFVSSISVLSADGDTTTQPKSVKDGGVELKVKRFPLSRYQANNEDVDNPIKGAFVGLTNVTFSFAGNIVRVVDAGMDTLYNLQPIDKFADSITNVSKTVYNTLKNNFGEALFIFAGGYVVYLFAVRGSAKEAMRRSILFICVLVIGGLWMSNVGYYMKALNALSVEVQGKLLTAGNGLVGIVGDEGNFADSSKIEKGKEMEGAVAVMRNVYFDIALKKPYLIVNYGETSEKKIHEKGGDKKGGLNRIDKLLSYKLSSEGEKEKLKYIKAYEIDKFKNEAVTSGNVFNQLGESFIAVIASIVIGIPFLALAFFNFLLQIIALAIVFFIPFAFIISYVPQMAYSGFVALGRLGSVFLLKALLGILILFVYVICFMVDSLIPPNGFGMYLLNVVVLASILWLGFKKRDSIIKFVTAGKVVSVDNNMLENMRQKVVQPAWETAKKGASTLSSGASNTFSHFAKNFRNRSGTGAGNNGTETSASSRGIGLGTADQLAAARIPQKIQKNEKGKIDRKPQDLINGQQNKVSNDHQNGTVSNINGSRKGGTNAPSSKDSMKRESQYIPHKNKFIRPSETSKFQSDGFSTGKKQTILSGVNGFVNKNASKRVSEKSTTLKRSNQIVVNGTMDVFLNDIASRSTSKGED